MNRRFPSSIPALEALLNEATDPELRAALQRRIDERRYHNRRRRDLQKQRAEARRA
ncbi:hypothetical protein [Microbacterium oxydans]|uniref:hypothetical protein n=1 Tax=Microbacterium oxydans TaxID=82380 RepID=UPI00226B239A|nr:hypothetical protein [Microbacterium oxydans]WAA67787.1 hypothetical protein MME74_08535 [Microbacterium oxydans]